MGPRLGKIADAGSGEWFKGVGWSNISGEGIGWGRDLGSVLCRFSVKREVSLIEDDIF